MLLAGAAVHPEQDAGIGSRLNFCRLLRSARRPGRACGQCAERGGTGGFQKIASVLLQIKRHGVPI